MRCSVPAITAIILVLGTALVFRGRPAKGEITFEPAGFVQADGTDIVVPGYSVPSFVDWNNDGLNDLIVGEGGRSETARVRVYLNSGTVDAPQFSTYNYVQSGGGDLALPGQGCLGLFPRVVYWNADDRKDLLVGQSSGYLKLFRNTSSDEDPRFDGGTFLETGQPGSKVPINVGYRPTPSVVDWNNDGRRDLVVGALDGKIRLFINEGSDVAPDFRSQTFVQDDGTDLVVPSYRSSPVVFDLDYDGKKDILTGNTNGQILFYNNVGTDDAPAFSSYSLVEADGIAIDLPGSSRSRPSVCDWTGGSFPDLLVGGGDGLVRLYQGVPEPSTFMFAAIGTFCVLAYRWQKRRQR